MATERQQHLTLVVDHARRVHEEWVQGETPYVTEALEEALDELTAVITTGDIPGPCREMVQRGEELTEHWAAWKVAASNDPTGHAMPGESFWSAWARLLASTATASRPRRRKIETMEQ